MGLLLKISWRNLWRNKRRTFITIAAVTFASAVFMFTRGMQYGTYEVNIREITHLFSGPMQIQHGDYIDSPNLFHSFELTDSLIAQIETTPGVTAWAPRIYTEALMAFQRNSMGVSLVAIDPQQEMQITTLDQKIKQGRFLTPNGSGEIVAGQILLKNLGATVGDTVVLLTQGFDGSLGNMKFTIVGSFRTGAREMDQFGVIMTLKDAQELLTMYGRVLAVVVDTDDLRHIDRVKQRLVERLQGTDLTVLTWDELLPEIKQAIQLDNLSGLLFLLLLVIVVAFGILNTLLMSVTERFREFGIMLSIGMSNRWLGWVVVWEGLFLTALGLVLGVLIAGGVNYYFQLHPIVFGGELARLSEEYGFLPVLSNTVEPRVWWQTIFSIGGISFLALVYPVIKVWHLEPLKGIRYT